MKQRVTLVVLLGVVGALGVISILGWLDRQWQQPLVLPEAGVTLSVEPGDSLRRVLARAEASSWLVHSRWVGFVASRKALDGNIHVGEYRLLPGLTAAEMVAKLAAGEVVHYQVTLPEGITLAAAIGILCETDRLVCTLEGPGDPALDGLVPEGNALEGWFLPETYRYRQGDRDIDVLAQSHALMRALLEELWPARAMDTPLATPYEALILASIVERETGVPDERPRIAGVFSRRLQQGMRLQTDPTVIYGLADQYRGNLTRAHLRDSENPYNTYRIDGLPPTPIALPGRAAIAAALQPEPGEDLYFVARGDGTHEFATSLAEHQDNVRRYQLQRRTDYRSSPP